MTTFAMTLPLARRSAIRIPRRDLVLGGGDSLTLAMTLVAADLPGAAPVDLGATGALVRLTVWYRSGAWDYGSVLWLRDRASVLLSVNAAVSLTTPGLATVALGRGVLANHCGPLAYSIQVNQGAASSEIAWGVLQVRPGLVVTEQGTVVVPPGVVQPPPAAVGPYLLNDDYTPILGDNLLPIGI